MPTRRRLSRKKNYVCNSCDKKYSSKQSLYYHNYHKHRNNHNEIIINDDEIIYKNNISDESETDDYFNQININDEKALIKLIEEENKVMEVIIEKEKNDLLEVNAEKVVIPEKVVSLEKAINIEKVVSPEKKVVISEKEYKNDIIKEVMTLFNKCIINNISVDFNININNSLISLSNKKNC